MNKRILPLTLVIVLLIFSSTGILLPITRGETELGSVHGVVVDDNDSFLKDVNVSVYDEYGKKLATDLTDEEGFFRFALYGGNYKFLIEKKGYVTVKLSITVPDNVGLFYEPNFDPVDMGIITLKSVMKLFTPVLVRVVKPDSTVTLPLTITNLSDKIEEIEFSTYNPDGWSTRVLDASGEVRKILLSSESSTNLNLEVSVPSNARGDNVVTVTALGSIKSTLNITIIAQETQTDLSSVIQVAVVLKEITAKAGATLNYPIVIRNKGDEDLLLLLNVNSLPENWDALFELEEEKEAVSQILLLEGETRRLDLVVTPPSIVDLGNYKIIAVIRNMDGTFEKQIDVGANIVGSYSLKVSASTLYTSATSGGSTSFTATVTNTGQSPVTTLKLSIVDIPTGWECTVTPIQIASITPKESSTFNVLTKIPDSAVAGDYMITVKAESDQVDSSEVQIRVTVSASTSWGLIGIGIAAVAIVGLIIVFRKFSRR